VLKPAVRRTLLFAVMMSVGLAVVFSVEDDSPKPFRKPAYGEVEPTPEPAVTLRDLGTETETQVKLGEIIFHVPTTVELPDGRLEKRKAYRIHILHGAPDDTGNFLVEAPHVTLLDLETGADRGSVRADQGAFESQQGGPIIGVFDPGSFDTKNFTLTGHVHGEMILEEGPPATFDGSELQVEGENLFAPGEVTLASETMTMHGTDMRWHGATSELRFETVQRIELVGEPGAVIESPRGLQWFLAESGAERGYGTLFGPITGHATDGSRMKGERLELSDNASSLTLVGGARYDLMRDGALWTLTADTITVRQSDAGGWELTRAQGSVRLASEDADPPGWFETDQLDGQGQSLVAMGPVRGRYGDFDITCVGLRWDEPAGLLDLLADVVIDNLATAPDADLPGAHVTSPGGVALTTDATGLRAHFAGPVNGSVPGMGNFSCRELTYDEAGLEIVLDGSAMVDFTLPDRTRELSGERVAITVDELGAPSAMSARGDVVLIERGDTGLLLRLAGPRLDVTSTLVSASEAFDLFWNGFDVSGVGLTLDDTRGLFQIDHTAHIARTLDNGNTEWIKAERGVTWWLPEDSSLGPAAGHGDFRGPISGKTEDGILVTADSLAMDGALQSLALDGSAVITHPSQGRIESEHLDLARGPAGMRVRSPVLVSWTGGLLSGHGTGLDYDEESGHFSLDHDVFMRLEQADGVTREITCDGRFTWDAPPGAIDPLMQGVGEFRENVIASNSDGSGFSADRLLADMPRNQVELFGECHVHQSRDDKLYALNTESSGYVRLVMDQLGQPLELDATGRIELIADDMKVQGDELNWDVPGDHVVMSGDCRLQAFGAWMSMPSIEVWPNAMKWFIPRNVAKFDVAP
jgi:hypothetical protein